MQKNTIALLIGTVLLIVAGIVVGPQLLGDEEVAPMRWDHDDEVEVAIEAPEAEAATATASEEQRTEVEYSEGDFAPGEERVTRILRGRVVDKSRGPVADATVWLGYSRGGRGGFTSGRTQRRIPEPVRTDSDGRFAFQGETFRNLRISLQVAHGKFAPGSFDRDIGEAGAEVDLGELVLSSGGVAVGRVTDLEGNGVVAAQVRLNPQGRSTFRFMRNRDDLLQPLTTDNNGYYRMPHVPAGDWVVGATADRHTEGRSAAFVVEEDQQVEVDDIRLGPGFEVTGYVLEQGSKPIAKARVTLRSTGRRADAGPGGRGGRGGPGGAGGRGNFGIGRSHTTETDAEGRFFLEHLPGVTMSLEVRADGYLDEAQDEVDPTVERPIRITMQQGLRIAGTVLDLADSQPVTMYSVTANRVRGLPIPGLENVDLGQLMQQLRSGDLDAATREQLTSQMRAMRSQFSGFGRGRRDAGQRGGRGGRGGDRNGDEKPTGHPGGTFVITGLQEGVYEVAVQSPDHAFYRSEEVELRHGVAAATLTIRVDRGLYFAGLVTDSDGVPIANADVELRAASALDNAGRGRGRDGGGTGNGPDFGGITRQLQRMAVGATVNLKAKTDSEGEFVFTHIPQGQYRLRAEASGFARSDDVDIELLTNRSDGAVQLSSLGAITGTVRGVRATDGEQARVAAVRVNGGQGGGFGFGRGRGSGFERADVAADGSYTIVDLAPGSYVVRAWVGDQQDIMRQLMPMLMGGELQPDVAVGGGQTAQLDLDLTRPMLGAVAGTVLNNGEPAKGFRVDLRTVDNGQDQGQGGRGGFGGRGGRWGGQQRATVSGTGTFKIERVTAGQYTLRVQTDNRTTVHEQPVFVAVDGTTDCYVTVQTSSLRGTVTVDGAVAKDLGGSVSLLAGVNAVPADYREWRRLPGNTVITGRVRDGAFEIEFLPTGNYLMMVTARGRERVTAPIFVTAGVNETSIAAGAVAAPSTNGVPTRAPGGRGGQGGGRGGR